MRISLVRTIGRRPSRSEPVRDRRTALQAAALGVLGASRVHRLLPPFGRGVVFAGHRVGPEGTDAEFAPNHALSITSGFLDDLLEHLGRRGIEVVTLSEAVERLGDPRAPFFAVFTFDDGYADNFEHALPVFARRNQPFAVYLATGLLDGRCAAWWAVLEAALSRAETLTLTLGDRQRHWALPDPAARRLAFADISGVLAHATAETVGAVVAQLDAQLDGQLDGQAPADLRSRPAMLTRDMIEQMADCGLVELGAHTVHHVRLATQDVATVERELVESRETVEALVGRPVRHLAYPYGNASSYGPREQRVAAAAGFETAVTTRKALLTDRDARYPWGLPRVTLHGHFQDLDLIDLFLTGLPFTAEQLRRIRPMPGELRRAG